MENTFIKVKIEFGAPLPLQISRDVQKVVFANVQFQLIHFKITILDTLIHFQTDISTCLKGKGAPNSILTLIFYIGMLIIVTYQKFFRVDRVPLRPVFIVLNSHERTLDFSFMGFLEGNQSRIYILSTVML